MSGSHIFPMFDITLPRLWRGDGVPGEVLAALERCSRIGDGRILIHVTSSDELFFHYSELVPTFRVPAGADLQDEVGDGQRSGADRGQTLDAPVVPDEDAGHLIASAGSGHVQSAENGDLDGAARILKDEASGFEAEAAPPAFYESREVGDWAGLLGFLGACSGELAGAHGCLLSTPHGRFLATFELLPQAGGRAR